MGRASDQCGAGGRATLLVLADGRFPAGGHAHSGGVEAAVRAGRVDGVATLALFCRGRLQTAGLVAAALAAAAAAGTDPLELDALADARTPSPALRATARRLGRQVMRAARVIWPGGELDRLAALRPRGAHHPVVLGVAARSAGLGDEDAAYCCAYEAAQGPVTAAVRLLGLDPFEATAVLARLAPEIDRVVADAVRAAHTGTEALPAASAPLLDITAEAHAAWPVRLFTS
ncbi:urease accessory protein UreF [Streptomyces sulfonofaciens]|uniref:Urease accessory protein UreF n=1 Tax=Streptomyces sulfonofaciens TaxID=68272 RepID=A0A919GRR1_9ACTN|nr:urease accessory UreF family protein [Streptomyces sulfonofaciens]GHH89028.1 urease accessory protein UreF [Streptomyces sulfonofaciens]